MRHEQKGNGCYREEKVRQIGVPLQHLTLILLHPPQVQRRKGDNRSGGLPLVLCSDIHSGGGVSSVRPIRLRRRSGVFIFSGSRAVIAPSASGSTSASALLAGGSCISRGGPPALAFSIVGWGGAGASSAVDAASSELVSRMASGSLVGGQISSSSRRGGC